MLLPLTKSAGIVDSTVKVLSHPATGAAAPIIAAGLPLAAEAMKKKPEEEPGVPKVAHLLPGFVFSIGKRAGLIDGAAKLLAKPAVQVAMNVAPAAMSMMGGAKAPAPAPAARPTGPEGTKAQPSGAFTQPMTRLASVVTTSEGSVDMARPVVPPAPVPSTRGNPTPTAHSDGSSQGPMPSTSAGTTTPKKSTISPGSSKAFKVGGLLDSPKLDRYLNLGSQAAVIGSAAIPAYQLWAEHQRQRGRDEVMDPATELRGVQTARQAMPDDISRKVAGMLPLQPKPPMLDRLGAGVRDFGEGAYDELDNQAGKLLTPSTHLDPIKNRTPPLSHII